MQLDKKSKFTQSNASIGTKALSAMTIDEILHELAVIAFVSEIQPEIAISEKNRMEALRVIIKYNNPQIH